MFVRLLLSSATLVGGLILGNWFLSFPSHVPFAAGDVATLAAPNRAGAPAGGIPASATAAATTRQQSSTPPAQAVITMSEGRIRPDSTVSRAFAPPPTADPQPALTRDLQAELLRLGCYGGPLDGQWTPALRNALQEFTFRLNATMPIDGPDVALLSLARGQQTSVCGTEAPAPASEQTAIGPTQADGLLFDGRMSLGATPGTGGAQKTVPSPRRATKDEKHFIHPLGQL